MKPRSFVGLDVHRKLVVATAVNALGKNIRQSSFGADPKELKRFLARLPKPTKVVLEACSFWERYYKAAISTGAEVVLSHPRNTRLIAEASIKTDKVDSATLANLLRVDSIPLAYIPPPEVRELCRLYFERRFYIRARTSVLQHAYSRIAELGIDYKRDSLQRKSKREPFRRLHIAEIDRAIEALEGLEKLRKELDRLVHAAYLRSEDAQILTTIPGIGELTAVALVGFLCPIERFPSVDKLSSYVGLCPTTHQSADSLYHGKLKKDCNRGLRWLLVEASWTHRVHARSGDVAKCARRVIRRKGKMRGTVAGAHKLLRIIYAILKQRRPYTARAPVRSVSEQQLRVSHPRAVAGQCVRRTSLGSPSTGPRSSGRASKSSRESVGGRAFS